MAIGTAYAYTTCSMNRTCVYISVNAADESVDKMLASYDSYVNQYIALYKKAKEGDPKALQEYPKLLKKAQDFQSKLEKVKDDMTTAQVTKLMKINKKLLNAIK